DWSSDVFSSDLVADRLGSGYIGDDHQDAPNDDAQADPSLSFVTQVAKQERGGKADDAQAANERDQPAIHEGEGGREQPERRRSSEREASAQDQRQHQQ